MTAYRADIDGLRAIAIVPVVMFHAGLGRLTGGFVGVDVFFVISGYLITLLILTDLEAGSFSLRKFWARRARRILPALILVIVSCLAASWFLFLPNDLKAMGGSAVAQSVFASNILFWIKTGYFSAPAETVPLLHTWSLAVEEQFYLLFPLLLVGLTRYGKPVRTWILLTLAALSFALSVWGLRQDPAATFYLLPTRAWELLTGALLALHVFGVRNRASTPGWPSELAGALGLALIAYAVFTYDSNTRFPGAAALIPCAGAAAVIWSNRDGLTLVGRLLALRPLVWIGLISYALYLWHWPLIVFAKYASADKLSAPQMLGIITGAFVLAWSSWKWIETPIRRGVVLRVQGHLVGAALIASCGCIAVGLLLRLGNGYPQRLPSDVRLAYERAFAVDPKSVCVGKTVDENLAVCANPPQVSVPDLILWGDSHAGTVGPRLDQMAQAAGLTLWRYQCIPVLGVYNVAEADTLAASTCHARNQQLVGFVERNRVPNILLVSFWSEFTEGREMPMDGAGQRDQFYADAALKSSSAVQARQVFRRHFIATVEQLRAAGAEVWIMKDVPSHQYWVANQLAKIKLYGGDPDLIGRPLAEYAQRNGFVNSVFEELQDAGVHILNPEPAFCHAGFCHAVENGEALYWDYNHLSGLGVRRLDSMFQTMLSAIVAQLREFSPGMPG